MPPKRAVLDVLKGEARFPPPIWMMRQAGRYLPEYRALRQRAGTFLDLCYTPDFAVEATLQPLRRFEFDAAILFSDILVVPHALGRDLAFEEGRGPVMTPMGAEDVDVLTGSHFHLRLEPIYETLRRLRHDLPDGATLLGFCGAPWTLATYMIAGHGTPDQAPARLFAFRHPAAFGRLLDILAGHCADYLNRQIDSGADAVQIFDSWAGILDDDTFQAYCVEPVRGMVERVKAAHPTVPIIGFPKGAGSRYDTYRRQTGVDALGLDWTVPATQLTSLQSGGAVQGNLDPLRLIAGGKALHDGIDTVLRAGSGGPLVFNLGHGIRPETPIDHVQLMIDRVRAAGA